MTWKQKTKQNKAWQEGTNRTKDKQEGTLRIAAVEYTVLALNVCFLEYQGRVCTPKEHIHWSD